jgi:hypothetical protein
MTVQFIALALIALLLMLCLKLILVVLLCLMIVMQGLHPAKFVVRPSMTGPIGLLLLPRLPQMRTPVVPVAPNIVPSHVLPH